jgi:hypothetical protein
MHFDSIRKMRQTLKAHWKLHEDESIPLPAISNLLDWASESSIHVYISYVGNYDSHSWKIRLWDMPPDNSYCFESSNFNDICKFLHDKLKEL